MSILIFLIHLRYSSASRQFVKFQREGIWILEKSEALAGGLIDSDRFDMDAMGAEPVDRVVDIGNFECEVAESQCLRIAQATWGVGKGKEFDLGAIGQGEVKFP